MIKQIREALQALRTRLRSEGLDVSPIFREYMDDTGEEWGFCAGQGEAYTRVSIIKLSGEELDGSPGHAWEFRVMGSGSGNKDVSFVPRNFCSDLWIEDDDAEASKRRLDDVISVMDPSRDDLIEAILRSLKEECDE